jgi:hypothetical protein
MLNAHAFQIPVYFVCTTLHLCNVRASFHIFVYCLRKPFIYLYIIRASLYFILCIYTSYIYIYAYTVCSCLSYIYDMYTHACHIYDRNTHFMRKPFVYKVGTICHSNLMQQYSVHRILLYSFPQFMTIVQRHT